MAIYFGNKQLFENKIGTKPIREVYFGNSPIIQFGAPNFTADEIIGEKAPAGDVPNIKGYGTSIVVSTNNYNPGYGYTKYYADMIRITMMYGGGLVAYDKNGNVLVEITGTSSFSYMTAHWTLGSKCIINGVTMFDESYSSTDIPSARLSYKVYYSTSEKKWICEWNNKVYKGPECEWNYAYFRVAPTLWMIPAPEQIYFYNGSISIYELNKGKGIPEARK